MQLAISQGKKEFISTFLLVIIYAIAFFGLQFFLYTSGITSTYPTIQNLRSWDAGWYQSIVDHGYVYEPGGQCDVAFYILFPFIWKITHFGVIGICILNILFFATGFSIMCSLLKVSIQNKILWLSIPAVFYVFVPYSEALFFLLSSITLYGITRKNFWIIFISLFLLSLTRATVVFLAPAFLAMVLLSGERKIWYKNLASYLVTYLLPMLAGTALFIWYQYIQTGVWFAFFDIEAKYWDHSFNWPKFPFTNLSGQPMIWISALSLFVGLFSFFFLFYAFFRWLIKNITQNNLLIASCGYLFMSMLQIIFYNSGMSSSTNVYNLLRHTAINPFFLVFLFHFTITSQYKWKHYVFIFFICNIAWLAFGSYLHILYFLYFTTNTIVVFLYMLNSNKKLQWPVLILTALNMFFQVYYFQHFISGIFTE